MWEGWGYEDPFIYYDKRLKRWRALFHQYRKGGLSGNGGKGTWPATGASTGTPYVYFAHNTLPLCVPSFCTSFCTPLPRSCCCCCQRFGLQRGLQQHGLLYLLMIGAHAPSPTPPLLLRPKRYEWGVRRINLGEPIWRVGNEFAWFRCRL